LHLNIRLLPVVGLFAVFYLSRLSAGSYFYRHCRCLVAAGDGFVTARLHIERKLHLAWATVGDCA
jgi:hypothetical protein